MRIINSTNHIDFACTTDLIIENSYFNKVGKDTNVGGAIYVSTSFSLMIVFSQFDECSAIEMCGAIYYTSSNCTLKQVCFTRCIHYTAKSSFDGAAAGIEADSHTMILSSIFQCSYQLDSGYISIRFNNGLMHIENNNCSQCKNSISGFAVYNPSTGSMLQLMQFSYMTYDALHLDYCANMDFNKCNIVYNTDENCWAIYVPNSDNNPITFTEFVLWMNARQVFDKKVSKTRLFDASQTKTLPIATLKTVKHNKLRLVSLI